MTFSRFLKSVVKAPVLAIGSAIVGVLFSALLLLGLCGHFYINTR